MSSKERESEGRKKNDFESVISDHQSSVTRVWGKMERIRNVRETRESEFAAGGGKRRGEGMAM